MSGISHYYSDTMYNASLYYENVIFYLSPKLDRKIKLLDLNDIEKRTKNISLLIKLIDRSKKFNSDKELIRYLKKIEKPRRRSKSSTYGVMPKQPKKDNQKVNLDTNSKWNEMTKTQLIKAASSIRGSKVRKPRKNASKKKWINFLERFSNKRWDEKNG